MSCLVSFRDVTDQGVAARALAAAEERWKFALEGAGAGVWDYDEDTRQIFYSKGWKDMLGHADVEIGSSPTEWSGRIHPDDREAVFAAITEYRSGRRARPPDRAPPAPPRWPLDRGSTAARSSSGMPTAGHAGWSASTPTSRGSSRPNRP